MLLCDGRDTQKARAEAETQKKIEGGNFGPPKRFGISISSKKVVHRTSDSLVIGKDVSIPRDHPSSQTRRERRESS